MAAAFDRGTGDATSRETLKELLAKIGQSALELDFFGADGRLCLVARPKAMIEPENRLSITRQCALLGLSRSSVYYRPATAPAQDLALMRRLDELHLQHPWMISRSMRAQSHRASCFRRRRTAVICHRVEPGLGVAV